MENATRSRRRPLALAGTVAAVFLGVAGVATADSANRPVPAAEQLTEIKPVFTPLGISNAVTTFVVQVAGDPVTVADAASTTGPLSKGQKRQLKDRLKQKQQPIEARIRQLGGTVLADYQSAYNGIKVRIAAKRIDVLKSIQGVVDIHRLTPLRRTDVNGVPLIGAPQVWGGSPGFHGEGIKIAMIDTGIDYTHADFGGPGTVAAYQAALGSDASPPDPLLFGPNAPRVKGGIDLVGDDYNADTNSPDYQPIPHPDPNPLDCDGHGTHTAGTAAGSGVLADGSTYTGPYDASTISSHDWNVGPGVAPLADIYSIRVFGCSGSTDVVVDAIEWAVDHDMDVINLSLGAPFGSADAPDAVAARNAASDGAIVVASAGNDGPAPYIVSTPSVGDGVLSVAANDATPSFPGADIALGTGSTLTAIEANGAPLPSGPLPVKVLLTPGGQISLGCDPSEYTAAGVAGAIVVTKRGNCARVARAIFGQQAGAAAVVMVNTSDTLPPYEGQITSNPDTGEQYTVTIPFLGVKLSDEAALLAADGGTATLTATPLTNPTYLATAGFSSGGPTSGDSSLAPDVTAPGVSVASAGVGTGDGPAIISGTSQAAPHAAGSMALVRQAHPNWRRVVYWEAALADTADSAQVSDYVTRAAGTGLIQVNDAVATQVIALGRAGDTALNFGFAELDRSFARRQEVRLHNFGNTPATFDVSTTAASGSPHSVQLGSSSISVPPRGDGSLQVELDVPVATAGGSSSFNDVAGLVRFTPTGGSNNGVTLSIPYYLVPQAVSRVSTRVDVPRLRRTGSTIATISNAANAGGPGSADWYAWGLADRRDHGVDSNDVQAVGVQSFPADGVLAFGIATYNRWSNVAQDEFDMLIDVDQDGTPDYDVVGVDFGLVTEGEVNGQMGSFVFNLRTGTGSVEFFADAPTDSSTLVLAVGFDQLCDAGSPCLDAANPRFSYSAESFGLADGTFDAVPGSAKFNAFSPSISTGMFDTVAPGASTTEPVTIDRAEAAVTPALGLMILSHDNRSADEAQLIAVR